MDALTAALGRFGGELAGLAAAFFWAASSIGYRRIGAIVPPLRLNLLKNMLATLMLAACLFLGGGGISGIESGTVCLFLVSGAVGVGLGDSAYFGALQALGARRALLMLVLAPPVTAALSLVFLGEALTPGAWLGVLATTAGVGWVISERAPAAGPAGKAGLRGIAWGLAAVLGQSVGSVLSHAAFLQSDTGAITSAFWRLTGGSMAVLLALPFERAPHRGGGPRRPVWGLVPLIVATVFMGTFLGMYLQQLSLKLTAAGVSQTLLSTSPLFVLPMAAWSGETVSLRAVLGALLAVAGAGLLFWTG
jgi:drug/metabolite transporter (DMT)-like permease